MGEFDGKVTLNAGASLDFESEPSLVQYSIAMFAKDSGGAGLSDMKTQIIFVRDVNDVTVTDLLDGAESAATPPGLSFKTDQTTSPTTITVEGTNFMGSWTSGNGVVPQVSYGSCVGCPDNDPMCNCEYVIPQDKCSPSSMTSFTCTPLPGAGTPQYWRVRFDRSGKSHGGHDTGAVNYVTSTVFSSYDAPAITNVVHVGGGTTLPTKGGSQFIVQGTNFGCTKPGTCTVPIVVAVTYGPTEAATKYTANACSITTPHKEITCTAIEGTGIALHFKVTVAGQTSGQYASTRNKAVSYTQPTIGATNGVEKQTDPTEPLLKTVGGEWIAINGENFGKEPVVVTYKNPAATCVNPTPIPSCNPGNKQKDGSACDCTGDPVQNPEWIYWCTQVKPCTFPEHNAPYVANCEVPTHTQVRCTTVAGTGYGFAWTIEVGQGTRPTMDGRCDATTGLVKCNDHTGAMYGDADSCANAGCCFDDSKTPKCFQPAAATNTVTTSPIAGQKVTSSETKSYFKPMLAASNPVTGSGSAEAKTPGGQLVNINGASNNFHRCGRTPDIV